MVITAGVSVSKMRSTTASGAAPTLLELIVVPVSDVDRAKAFYAETLGFRLMSTTTPATRFAWCS